MLAAVVSYLGGKLRDYRGHYGASLDEMELAVAVWSQCIVALQPADATPAAAAAGLRVQAQQLIEASVVRHVKRVRLALSRRPPPAAPAAPPPPADGGEESPASCRARQAAAQLALEGWRVGVLAAAVRDELEAEGRFARCFDACVDDGAADEEGSALRFVPSRPRDTDARTRAGTRDPACSSALLAHAAFTPQVRRAPL